MNKTLLFLSVAAIFAVLLSVLALGLIVFRPTPGQYGGATFAATFGENEASSTNPTVKNISSVLIPANGKESFWNVCNTSTSAVWLSLVNPATSSFGILLNPMGSSTQTCYGMKYPSIDNGNVYAISGTTTTVSLSLGFAL